MPLFLELSAASTDENALQTFILGNIQRFHDLYNGHYSSIIDEKSDIREFIRRKAALLERIDYSYSECKAFISILFDFCDRFGFICTTRIENALSKRELYLGFRREAAKLYLLNIRNNDDYITRFEEICRLIQCSLQTEEDNEKRPIVTFSNYIAKVVRDTTIDCFTGVKEKIRTHSDAGTYPFLRNQLIQEIYHLNFTEPADLNNHIQDLIESYLGHVLFVETIIEVEGEEILIETDTEYCDLLPDHELTFDIIRRIAVENCNHGPAILEGRGVNPLRSEREMFVYLKRYGNMHKAKMDDALNHFPFGEIDHPVEIIDWGCGQGLASIVLMDYIRNYHIHLTINKLTLIEPSELSLRRASLHITRANHDIPFRTICKGFNDLNDEDVLTQGERIKIHLFSNVLDIDEERFLQQNLIRLIEDTQEGINYFICISPYITDEKADRVNAFKRHLEDKYETFKSIYEIVNSGRMDANYWNCNNNYNGNMNVYCRHPECGCDNKWTRIINIFRLTF